MKKYMYCFLLFIATSIVCLIVGYAVTRYSLCREPRWRPRRLMNWKTRWL